MPTGSKIKEIRIQKGLTQKQLGELCGMADSAIRRYENGNANPKIETLQKIADALEVSMDELMGKVSIGNFTIPEEVFNNANYRPLLDAIGNGLGDIDWDKMHNAQNAVYKNLILTSFYKLNDKGKEKAIERVEELLEIEKYRLHNDDDNQGTNNPPV